MTKRIVIAGCAGLVLLRLAPNLFWGLVLVSLVAAGSWGVLMVAQAQRRVRQFGPEVAHAVAVLRSDRRWRSVAANVGLARPGERPSGLWGGAESVRFIPRVVEVRPAACGAVAIMVGAPGHDLAVWTSASGRLASALGVSAVTVSEPAPNRFALALRTCDPLAEPMIHTGLSRPSDVAFVLGATEFGDWVELRLANHSGVVVSGEPGSGKSAWLGSAVGGLLRSSEVQALIIDGKGGHDLSALAPRAYEYLSGDRSDPLSVELALRGVQELMRRRLANAMEWFGAPNYWTHGPSDEHPLVVVVLDEAQTYLDLKQGLTKDEKARLSEIQSVTMDLIKKGRGAGILVVLATQKPTADSIPTAIRDNCALRVCFRVATREAADAALGQLSNELPSPVGQDRGIGVAVSPDLGVVRFRAPFVSVAAVEDELSAVTGLTKDPLSGLAV
ncbi:cell division protein FtsK [Mycobacterium syngnathidarum]